jgi:hypothetical protein
MYLILTQHILDGLLIQPGQCPRTIQLNPSKLSLSNVNIRRIAIEPDSHLIQLPRDLNSLLLGLTGIKHHQDHIGVFGDCDDLSASALALSGTFDDTGQIQQLDLGVVVVDDTWDAGQCRELVGSGEGGGVGDRGQ